MPDTRDLLTGDAVSAFLNHFFEGSQGDEGVPHLASESCGVSLQRRECDIALGFGALGVHDCSLGDANRFRELSRGHSESVANRA